jgi:polyisoprenoid-binding protein YceI
MPIWKLDTDHTGAEFSVRHMNITTVRGKFAGITGILDYDPENPEGATVEAAIPVNTLQTGTPDRDKHLLSSDFFDVERFPVMTFKSSSVESMLTRSRARLIGELTIGRVTRSVALDVEYFGQDTSLEGETRIGFSAITWVNREDFGLTWNRALTSGNWLIDKNVKITLDVQATLVTESLLSEDHFATADQV